MRALTRRVVSLEEAQPQRQGLHSYTIAKEQLGHHSNQIPVDTYGHLVPGGNRQAVDKLDGLENTTIRDPDATSDVTAGVRRGGSA
jgi:hypothetical protein